jgi:hypothetical protein
MNAASCHACQSDLDQSDNFCRRCGVAAHEARLPAVRGVSTPALWQPQVSPVVKGAAVMAAGTIGQFVFRRMVSSVLGGGKRQSKALRVARPTERDGLIDEAQIITETVMMRRVRIRRQV